MGRLRSRQADNPIDNLICQRERFRPSYPHDRDQVPNSSLEPPAPQAQTGLPRCEVCHAEMTSRVVARGAQDHHVYDTTGQSCAPVFLPPRTDHQDIACSQTGAECQRAHTAGTAMGPKRLIPSDSPVDRIPEQDLAAKRPRKRPRPNPSRHCAHALVPVSVFGKDCCVSSAPEDVACTHFDMMPMVLRCCSAIQTGVSPADQASANTRPLNLALRTVLQGLDTPQLEQWCDVVDHLAHANAQADASSRRPQPPHLPIPQDSPWSALDRYYANLDELIDSLPNQGQASCRMHEHDGTESTSVRQTGDFGWVHASPPARVESEAGSGWTVSTKPQHGESFEKYLTGVLEPSALRDFVKQRYYRGGPLDTKHLMGLSRVQRSDPVDDVAQPCHDPRADIGLDQGDWHRAHSACSIE